MDYRRAGAGRILAINPFPAGAALQG